MPAHNAEDYLEETVNSLTSQTHKDLEIILINNGSIDATLEICERLAAEDNRIIVLNSEEAGVSKARNRGLDIMTGEYVTFVDSDDWLESIAIERAVENIIGTQSDIVIWSFFKNYDEREVPLALLPGEEAIFETEQEKEFLYLKSIYAHYQKLSSANDVPVGTTWCKLYRSKLIQEHNFRFKPELIRAEDVIFSIYAFSAANKIYYFNENLYHYRIHSDSICNSSRFIEDTLTPFETLIAELQKFANFTPLKERVNDVIYYRIIQIIYWHFDYNYFNPLNPESLLERRKEFLGVIHKSHYQEALENVDIKQLAKQLRVMVVLLRKDAVLTFNLFRKIMIALGR